MAVAKKRRAKKTNNRPEKVKIGKEHKDRLDEWFVVTEEIDQLTETKKELGGSLINDLDAAGQKSLSSDKGAVSVIHSDSTTYDEDRLKKRVGAKAFHRMQRPVLDRDLILAEIKAGRVEAEDVAACEVITPRAPYLKRTRKS